MAAPIINLPFVKFIAALHLSRFYFYRELFWMGTLLSCNYAMPKRMHKRGKRLTKIGVLQNYL